MLITVTDPAFIHPKLGLAFTVDVSVDVVAAGFYITYRVIFKDKNGDAQDEVPPKIMTETVSKTASANTTTLFNNIVTAVTNMTKNKFT